MPDFAIVARRFLPSEFSAYLAGISLTAWKPDKVILHNTAVPTLADRPDGFSVGNMRDLMVYYGHVQGWSGGPHLFIDPNGVWVFNPLDRRGVHSPSWNSTSWGVEMLGDYETEAFDAGRGAAVRDNSVSALATMLLRLGLQPTDERFKLHREDPKTTHLCPGRNVRKEEVRARVIAAMNAPASSRVKLVVYRKGRGNVPIVLDASLVAGVTTLDTSVWNGADLGVKVKGIGPRPLRELAGDRYDITPRLDQGKVYLVERT